MYKNEIATILRNKVKLEDQEKLDANIAKIASLANADHSEAIRINAGRNRQRACVISVLTQCFGLKVAQARGLVRAIGKGYVKGLKINYED